jgi:1-acyl-sn-glycerol-3-phosphate acyltransferase
MAAPGPRNGGLGAPAPERDNPVALRSERMLGFFEVAFTRTFAGSFQALRVSKRAEAAYPADTPLILLANHPSWWDGVMFMLLLRKVFPGRPCFFPMDAAAIEKYRFMKRLGVFGIEQESARGAVRFLRTAKQVLDGPDHMLWMNAPGRFADVRERPVPVAPGAVRLPEIAPHAQIGTMAFEYTHWTEKRGEALVAFGPAVPCAELAALQREERLERLRGMLTSTMDTLAEDAISRDPARFRVIVEGKAGMGGVYGLVQYFRALRRGERFDPRHETRPERGAA